MKKFFILLCCCSMLFIPTPVHAYSSHILIRSQQVPYVFLVDVLSSKKLTVYIFPENLYLPNDHNTLLNIKKEDIQQIQSRIEKSYQIPAESYLDLHLDQVEKDFDLPLKDYDMSCMDGITHYFEDLKEKLSLSDIVNYQRYISSDLNLNDYYSYYRMFQSSVEIEYIYASYFTVNAHNYPMALLPH